MDWLKYRKIYFLISGSLILVGLFSLIKWRLNLGVDFKGGSILELKFENPLSTEEADKRLEQEDIEVTSIQSVSETTYIFRFASIDTTQKEKVKEVLTDLGAGQSEELRFESVGPTVGPTLVKKTVYAIAVAAISILLWIGYQFKSIKFGASAILAMFHDSFILVGLFSLLGHFFNAEVDFLFVTAVLTSLSFSVHDTIVVYDRIRELQKKLKGELIYTANSAISETMVRSLNNSFTIIFMLFAFILLGGTTIKWFAVALFIGTVLGTYSSPFVAVPLLVAWSNLNLKERMAGVTGRLKIARK